MVAVILMCYWTTHTADDWARQQEAGSLPTAIEKQLEMHSKGQGGKLNHAPHSSALSGLLCSGPVASGIAQD